MNEGRCPYSWVLLTLMRCMRRSGCLAGSVPPARVRLAPRTSVGSAPRLGVLLSVRSSTPLGVSRCRVPLLPAVALLDG